MRGIREHLLLSLIGLTLTIGASTGCQSIRNRATWRPASVTSPRVHTSRVAYRPVSAVPAAPSAEVAYAAALQREADGNAACVDEYFRAATTALSEMERKGGSDQLLRSRPAEIYHSALTKIVSAGQRFGRFDPRMGVHIESPQGRMTVPLTYRGFPWSPDDFNALVPVGDYSTRELKQSYGSNGWGVSAVAIHRRAPDERFRKRRQVFAATVVLNRNAPHDPAGASYSIDLIDPLRVASVYLLGKDRPLERDLTAPIVYALKDERKEYLEGFLRPGSTKNNTGLFMIEPFQRHKVPVIFVHGLLSDPFTWAHLANELRARSDLNERYQIWGFEYPTGEPFLQSAATLRRQLLEVKQAYDPDDVNPNLARIVLVGHSMGGIVSKLQVTSSGNALWRSVSSQPFSNTVMSDEIRSDLAETFFFEPVPWISRVVFVATPHRGSGYARRTIGRLAAALVTEPSSMQAEHAQLIRDNPGSFTPAFTRRIPTSVDLLRPDSQLLQAIDSRPIARHVQAHSIVGSGSWTLFAGDSDGIVPVSSARISGVDSEVLVRAGHSEIHRTPAATDELFRILRSHLLATGHIPSRAATRSSRPVWRP